MPSIDFNGQKFYIPGVYTKQLVASSLPGPLPAFHIPVLLGFGPSGHPYDADSKLVTGETPFSPFKLCQTDGAVGAYFGRESRLHRGARFAKRHGLPLAYVANLSSMTRFSIIADTVTTNVEQFTLHSRTFGPIDGYRKIEYASGIFTTTPVKRFAMLSANASSSATRLSVTGKHDWLSIGAAVTVVSNNVAAVSRTITNAGEEITSTGQRNYWIEISSTVGSGLDTAQYAAVLQYDTDNLEISPALTTSGAMIDWFNNFSIYWRAVQHANFTGGPPAAVTAGVAKEVTAWNTVTVGTAPAATSADVDAFIAIMNASAWAEFAVREQALPQTYCVLDSTSTFHTKMRDYSVAERVRGFPISVTVGCAWGDHVLNAGNDTDPLFRAAALNSENVMLCAGGLDRESAALSMSPAVWGRRVAGGPGHNLTNDELIFSELERKWNEIDSGELTSLSKKGVVTQKLSIGNSNRYKISQGLTTNQNNAGLVWNESDATTWSAHQRDLADFVDRVLKVDFEEQQVGADRVDANAIAATLKRRADKSLIKRGFITTFTITSIALNSAGNGYDVTWTVTLPTPNDYVTFTTTIFVGEA